jgi:hypothetical protein
MAKHNRILSLFPSIYRARDNTKLLASVVRALAEPLEQADSLLFRIQRAHRINVAEEADDIVRLAASLDLAPFHCEDILQDKTLSSDERLNALRNRVKRIARVQLEGLGTPWAVLEAAAIFLNATIVPEQTGDPLVKHEDAKLYSHKAVLRFDQAKDKPREPIYLHEGLLRRNKVDPAPRYPLNSWAVLNDSLEPAPVRIVIQGIRERTVLPSVFCPETQQGIVFNGVVPDSKTLVIDSANGTTLDGNPMDEWVTYYRAGIAGFGSYGGANYSTGRDASEPPFDGELADLSAPPYQAKRPVPAAPVGSSSWHFTVARGVYDGSSFDFAVCDIPELPIGACNGDFQYDSCVYSFDPSASVGIAWDERVTCAFKLLLPAKIPIAASATPSSNGAQPVNYVGRIGSILPRFKPAGVRAYVDNAPEAWIVGESVLRDAGTTTGEGIEFHPTVVRNPEMELFV